jgi:hypothetical protein
MGALAWAGAYSLVGFIFRDQMNSVLDALLAMGPRMLTIIGIPLAVYILYKYVQRRRFYHKLRVARIQPHELRRQIEKGEDVVVIDLRNALEREDDSHRIPGAFVVNFEDIESGLADIPRDKDVVLYCT